LTSIEINRVETDSQLVALSRLAHEIWNEHYPPIIGQAQVDYMLRQGYTLEALRKDIEDNGAIYERAGAAGRTLGFSSHGPGPAAGEWKLHKIYVKAAERGSGAGRALVASALSCAGREGCDRLTLSVNKNNGIAIAAYTKLGFSIRESVVVDIGGGFVMDDYIMTRPL